MSVFMPPFLIGLSKIAPSYWGAYLMTNLAFTGQTFTCEDTERRLSDGKCLLADGKEVLSLYKMNDLSMPFAYLMLTIVTFVYFFISFLCIRWRAIKLLA
jgi:hypothetical protein